MNSLRVFEATARSGSLDDTSEEIHISNGAISRHIKQLEDWLRVPLFDRKKRSLELTAAGREYSEKISVALDLIVQATAELHDNEEHENIGISTTHSVAARLLSNKLNKFYDCHNINVSLSLEQKLNTFTSSNIDLAIRCGSPPWDGVITLPLLEDRLIPVCHPDLIPTDEFPLTDKVLASYPLLHDDDPNSQWQRWFNLKGKSLLDITSGPRYPSTDLLINAAVHKQGIALVSQRLTQSELRSGELIQVHDKYVDLGVYYWLVMPEESLKSCKVKTFCIWLYQELGLNLDLNIFNK